MTSIAAGASNVTVDHFCQCRMVSNAGSQAIMIPHQTLAEFASFYNNPPTNVTASNTCFGGGTASFNIADLSGPAVCPGTSVPVAVTTNDGTINVRKTGLANCIVTVKTVPPATTKVASVGTTDTSFSVCVNDYIHIEVSCLSGVQTGTVIFETSGGSGIDTVNVNLNFGASCF